MEYTDDDNDDYADEYEDDDFGDESDANEDELSDPDEHDSDPLQSNCGGIEHTDWDGAEGEKQSAELSSSKDNAGGIPTDQNDIFERGRYVEENEIILHSLDADNSVEQLSPKQDNDGQLKNNDNQANTPVAPSENDTIKDDLHKKLWAASKKLVGEGEKNVTLALQVEQSKDELKEIKKEIEHFRQLLLRGINGGITDVNNYAHVSLGELLRLRLQEDDQSSRAAADVGGDTDVVSQGPGKSFESVQRLERELAMMKQRNNALERKCSSLKDELNAASKGSREVKMMKRKMGQIVDRSRHERDIKIRLEREVMTANEKVEALSDHIEKLMIHLKHEAISKARALAEQTRTQRDVELLKARNQKMTARNTRKDQAIIELKEGGKILEDQLRLMDEKYIELRTKLDWTRTNTERTIRKKEEEIRQLRAKFALFAELNPNEKMASAPLLDEYDFGALKTAEAFHETKSIRSKAKGKEIGGTKSHRKFSGSINSVRERGIT